MKQPNQLSKQELTPGQAIRAIRATVKLERNSYHADEIFQHILDLCERTKEDRA